jgi:hypothetical protein
MTKKRKQFIPVPRAQGVLAFLLKEAIWNLREID